MVEYDTFDSDATLEAKMLAGGGGYDVVSTSEDFFSRQIKAGAYESSIAPAAELEECRSRGTAHARPSIPAMRTRPRTFIPTTASPTTCRWSGRA